MSYLNKNKAPVMTNQMNFFDLSNHYARLSPQEGLLERLLKVMDFNIFLRLLEKAFAKQRKVQLGEKRLICCACLK